MKKAKKRAGKARKEALWLKGELWRMRKEAWEGGKTSVDYGQGDTKALSVMVEEGSAGEGIFDRDHGKEDPVERLKGSAEVSGQVERVSGGEDTGSDQSEDSSGGSRSSSGHSIEDESDVSSESETVAEEA